MIVDWFAQRLGPYPHHPPDWHGCREALRRLCVPDSPRAGLLAMEGASTFEPMAGRAMKEYVVVPPSLPPKAAKAKAKRKR
jgi:hypothetical protein